MEYFSRRRFLSETEVRRLRRVAERDKVFAAAPFWSPSGSVLVDVFGVAPSAARSSSIAPPAPAPGPSSEDRGLTGLLRRSEIRVADWAGASAGAGCSSASTARSLLSSSARVFSSSATTCCARHYKQRRQLLASAPSPRKQFPDNSRKRI